MLVFGLELFQVFDYQQTLFEAAAAAAVFVFHQVSTVYHSPYIIHIPSIILPYAALCQMPDAKTMYKKHPIKLLSKPLCTHFSHNIF